ncbi:MAG: bifunctional homocysteine S-methyltransferase/methylenetetrahydrofolate reductase [Myxococcales bacterium]|nr:bifunctional homocysteine S-methyltransferase/methylenetetrahydrofolate reductase [Myxococcales bacterium]
MAMTFLDALRDHPLVADGAMGTQLYERGILFTQNYEEINLSRPDLIRAIHKDYLKAGAQVVETNTFGANRIRLARFQLEGKVRLLNETGVRLAREAIADATPGGAAAFVAGAIGPSGLNLKGLPERDLAELRAAFVEQAEGLRGADIIVLETMRQPEELRLAIEAVRGSTDLPLIACASFDAFGAMADGTAPEQMAERLALWGADVIGVNCGDGPAGMYEMVERMRGVGLPLAAMPNAGVPRRVEGRFLYMANPEYFGVYARRMMKLGVRMVGGCCGTTAEHIRRVANAARMLAHESDAAPVTGQELASQDSVHEVQGALSLPPGVVPAARAEKSAFAAKIGQKFVVSVEVNPPASLDPSRAIEGARNLIAHGVDIINIADGPRASARMGNLALAVRLLQEGIEPLLHVCCRDRNVLGLVGHVLGAHELGVRNLVVITGDPPKMGDFPDCTAVYDMDSVGLLRLCRGLNHGRDPGGKAIGGVTKFLLATGAEPAAMDYPRELARLKKKVEAGAELVMTQPVYDPAVLDRFLDDIAPLGVPVMVGLLPLASHRNAEFLHNEVPGMRIPEATRERMRLVGSGPGARKEGVAIAREMLQAVRPRVAGAYIMPPLERWEMALEVIDGVV